jgi:hypothetical protein
MTQDEIIKMANKASKGYHCVICGRFLLADEHGVILHDDIEHPLEMTFDDEEKPQ